MSSTTFTNGVTLTDDGWFQDVNDLVYGGPASAAITYAQGSFTATAASGWTTTPTTTVKWTRVGNMVTLDFGNGLTGTSNATGTTATGLPSALQPSATKILNGLRMIDNGGADSWGLLVLSSGSGTMTFYKDPAGSNWTNSGTKTIDSGMVTYILA